MGLSPMLVWGRELMKVLHSSPCFSEVAATQSHEVLRCCSWAVKPTVKKDQQMLQGPCVVTIFYLMSLSPLLPYFPSLNVSGSFSACVLVHRGYGQDQDHYLFKMLQLSFHSGLEGIMRWLRKSVREERACKQVLEMADVQKPCVLNAHSWQ